ncbi:hydroxypyruvate isomerase family protein [Vibrio sp.]|nr:hydroxypyruvate isomerase family protein [Vibrio sp.]
MAKFAANLTMLYTEFDFLERFEKAAQSGFKAVEFLFPYDYEPELLAEYLRKYQLEQALFNLYPGNWAGGEKGFASLPGEETRFRQSVEQAIPYAVAMGCKKVHVMSGIMNPKIDRATHEKTFISNVRYAGDQFAKYGIKVVLEPLNSRDVPNYFISHQREAVELIKRIERDNVFLQFDVYHAQIMDGDLTVLIQNLAPYIGHVQIASVPARNEPTLGEVNFNHIFNILDNAGYQDWIGCEYNPKTTTEEGLGWFKSLNN